MPAEVVNEVLKQKANAYDFTYDQIGAYPDRLFVRVDGQYLDVSTKSAYNFQTIRGKLMKWWQVTENGPVIDPNWSQGIEARPLDITDLNVSLSDFKIIMMLIHDEEHKQVKNLTGEVVDRLDKAVKNMRLDANRFLYNGRSRVGDETGSQMEVTFFGKNVSTKGATFSVDFENLVENKSFRYAFSLEFKLPEDFSCVLEQKLEFKKPKANTFIRIFNHFPDNVCINNMADSKEEVVKKIEISALDLADKSEEERQQAHLRSLFQLEDFMPGVLHQYGTFGTPNSPGVLEYMRLVLKLDFPTSLDRNVVKEKLEKICKKFKDEAIESQKEK